MRRSRFPGPVLLALVAVAAAGCKRKYTPPPEPDGPINVTFVATDYAFQGPDSIPAGLTRLSLIGMGPSLHHLQLIRLDSGRTFDSLMAALRHPGRPAAWAGLVAGPNAGLPHDTTVAALMLAPGHYAVICFIPDSTGAPHFTRGMVRPLEVTVSGRPEVEMPADIQIHLVDYDFRTTTTYTARRHRLKVINDGPQSHEMLIVRLDSGATAQQFVQWADGGMHGRPPGRPMGGVTGMAPGSHAWVPVILTRGDYALICFLPDDRDGKPHTAHGMVKQIHID